jgi:glycerol kinase
MAEHLVLAVDQGTSSSKAVAFDLSGTVLATSSVAIGHATPRPGWVEQDPDEILASVTTCLVELADRLDGPIAAVGLSSQRESAVAWDATTGTPLSPLLGWQDRRTAKTAQRLLGEAGDEIRKRTGLPLDPMFSALKLAWILDQIDPDRRRARNGEIRLGTVDAWLADRLTGEFRIEAGNASRTQLMNLESLEWDDALLELFDIPLATLPTIRRSDDPTPPIAPLVARGREAGFSGILGDSHAALFGHGVRRPGTVKATYGTGSSIMGLTALPVSGDSGLVHTLGWLTDRPARAFEGNILSTGATLVWLARLFGVSPGDLDQWARAVPDAGGVSLVPAFAGLGAPYWDASAQAVISGFDQGTAPAHLARAAFEAIIHQIEDVVARADQVAGERIGLLLADGGPSRNDWLMQLQADNSGRVVSRPENSMLSVTGAAHMAGLSAGFWDDFAVAALPTTRQEFVPGPASAGREARRNTWARAVARARMTT